MKKKLSLLYLIGLFCTVSLMTTSCSDDKNGGTPGPEGVNATYSTSSTDNVLALTYSAKPLIGKDVTFNTTDGETAPMTLKNILPGEVTTTLANVPLTLNSAGTVYSFDATDAQEGARTVKFSGTVEKGKMALNLTVTMPDNELTGKWTMPFVVTNSVITLSPVYMDWAVSPNSEDQETNGKVTSTVTGLLSMAPGMAGKVLAACLRSVTFGKDGNITAEYASLDGIDIQNDIMMSETFPYVRPESDWTASPVNLCTYYVKNNKVYVVPSIDMIMAAVGSNAGAKMKSENTGGIGDIIGGLDPALIAKITEWLTTGVPLNIKTENGITSLYLDKDSLSPFFPLLSSMTDTIVSLIPEDMAGLLPFIGIHLDLLPEVLTATTKLDIGLNLEKAAN